MTSLILSLCDLSLFGGLFALFFVCVIHVQLVSKTLDSTHAEQGISTWILTWGPVHVGAGVSVWSLHDNLHHCYCAGQGFFITLMTLKHLPLHGDLRQDVPKEYCVHSHHTLTSRCWDINCLKNHVTVLTDSLIAVTTFLIHFDNAHNLYIREDGGDRNRTVIEQVVGTFVSDVCDVYDTK